MYMREAVSCHVFKFVRSGEVSATHRVGWSGTTRKPQADHPGTISTDLPPAPAALAQKECRQGEGSAGHPATVDGEACSRDAVRVGSAQVQHQRGDVLGFDKLLGGLVCQQDLVNHLLHLRGGTERQSVRAHKELVGSAKLTGAVSVLSPAPPGGGGGRHSTTVRQGHVSGNTLPGLRSAHLTSAVPLP